MFPWISKFRWLGILFAFILVALSQESLAAQSDHALYYYYQGTRVPLSVNPSLIAVRFDSALSPASRQAIADATGDVDPSGIRVDAPVGNMVFIPMRAGTDPLAAVLRFQARSGVQLASPVYDFGTVQMAETNEFLARFPETTSDAEIARINASYNVSVVSSLPNSKRVLVLKPNAGNPRSARALANAYVEAGIVEFAEPNFVLRQTAPLLNVPGAADITPNDSNFGLQWSLKNTQQFQGSLSGADINATNAWDITRGAGNIKIAVIDEGIDETHPDLAGKVLNGFNAMNGSDNTSPAPNDHHGTGVAGVIAADSNEGAGMAGVCWACQVLPVKVAETDSQGNWVTSTGILSSGIDWAWQNGADVLNNSWTMVAPSDSVQLAIINARFGGRNGKGSTVVFATGNEDKDVVAFPSSLNSYVIAVGATNWCDQRKTMTANPCNFNDAGWGSNYGTALDLVAPGEAIFTACNGDQDHCTSGAYTYMDGTSFATPLVSGVAGLLYSLNPDLTPDKIQAALQAGAKDLGSAGRDNETGYGRLDAYRTLVSLYNLQLKLANRKKFVHPDETIDYKIKYFNTGNAAMNNTQIFVTLPDNVTYVSSSPAFTKFNSNTYRLDLGTLGISARGVAKFRVRVNLTAAGQPVTFSATISGAFSEFNTADNTKTNTALTIKRQVYLPWLKNFTP